MPHPVWGGIGQLSLPVLVGLHHKTGTRWMRYIFKTLAATLRQQGARDLIRVSVHSQFSEQELARDFRGFHMIRDPRDVVISGLHYHKKSDEKWLHVPQEEFGGLTYQQKLNSLPSHDEQFFFELNNCAKATISAMAAWRYDDPRFYEARYEDMVNDVKALKFTQALMFLGFHGPLMLQGTQLFLATGLFPGKPIPEGHSHIRNGQAQQWRTDFRRRQGEQFVELLGDCLIRLGYEPDHSWVERLPA